MGGSSLLYISSFSNNETEINVLDTSSSLPLLYFDLGIDRKIYKSDEVVWALVSFCMTAFTLLLLKMLSQP